MKHIVASVILLVASVAQATGLVARVSRDTFTMEDSVVLTLTVEGSNTSEPKLPDLSAFEVNSRGQSTSVQIVNGVMRSSVGYNFLLTPKRPGTFTIGSASATIDGRAYQSQPFTVRVTQAAATRSPGENDSAAFLEAEASTLTPYVGQQVVYTFRFFRRVRITNAKANMPDFNGFVVEDLGDQTEYSSTRNGMQYVVTELRKLLTPQEAGTHQLPAASLTAEVVTNDRRGGGNSPFDDFFGRAQTQTKTLRSQPLTFNVRALPTPPPGFSGLMGRFTLQTTLSNHLLQVGESATLTTTIRGDGNLRSAQALPLPDIAHVKTYDEKPQLDIKAQGQRTTGQAVFSKALIPSAPGEFDIPAQTLVYFNPELGQFETSQSAPIHVQVEGTALREQANVTAPTVVQALPAKSAVQILGDDLLPIHAASQGLHTRAQQRLQNIGLMALLPLVALLYGVWAWLLGRREALARDPKLQRKRRALATALSRLKDAEEAQERGDAPAALGMMARAFREFLGDKLHLEGRALTADEIRDTLTARHVNTDLVARAHTLAFKLEEAQYAGQAAGVNLSHVRELLGHVDRAV